MTTAELEALLARVAGTRVLCVGDLVLDRFVYGAARRVSREAPVVTLAEADVQTMLGSCGNVARNVASLGGRAVLAAVVGDDPAGHEVSGRLAETDVADVELIVERDRVTPVKTRYVASNQQILCVDRDPDGAIGGDTEDRLIDVARSAMANADIVIVSDYGRGGVTARVVREVIAAANAAGRRVIADPRGRDFSRYDGAFLLKPNAQELATAANAPCRTDEEAAAALAQVMGAMTSLENLLVTRGPKGMALLPRGGAPQFFPVEPRDVFDVSGAGDTTLAALGLALAAQASLPDAIAFANRAAGVVVTKVATAAVTGQEVLADARGAAPVGAPMLTLDAAREAAARWRAEGRQVGLTNGCFDILHVGHARTLQHARSLCDRLIVGVNADASVRRLKGAGRPVNPEGDRARLVAAVGAVDAVVVFGDDTAERLVEAVRPAVYVKGGDYDPETLPEAGAVRAVGGRIHLTPLEAGRSTSALIAALARGDD